MHSPSPPLSPAVIVLLFFRNPTLHPLFFLLLPCFPLTLTLPSTTLDETLSPAAALAPAIERRRERESKRTAREHSESREREQFIMSVNRREKETAKAKKTKGAKEGLRGSKRSELHCLSLSPSRSVCLASIARETQDRQMQEGCRQREREQGDLHVCNFRHSILCLSIC